MAEINVDIIYAERVTPGVSADTSGNALWLTAVGLEGASGWAIKPEGFCKGDVCVPIPPDRSSHFEAGKYYNLAALAALLGQPVVADEAHRVWCFGEAAAERKRALTSRQAPDFELPDLEGRTHRLSDYRGKKIFLVSWASW
jgi:AhpC/TSA family